MKTYLKDLTPEEIIKRLKNGEIIKLEDSKDYSKMVDGVLCYFYEDRIYINSSISTQTGYYFETEEPLTFEAGKLYKTRDGRKAFVSKIYKTYVLGLIMNDDEFIQWRCDGFIFDDKRKDNQDLISKWED